MGTMNMTIHRAASRGFGYHGWLKTYHTFSFANYHNPGRMGFGALRVLNDDTVAAEEGFDMHPHRNMEVISIPLRGYLRHEDSLKNEHVLTRGEIQVMSAGSGVFHSEFNDSETEELEFLQIWVIPRRENQDPVYHDYDIKPLLKHNEIATFIAPGSEISIDQNAWFSWAVLDGGEKRTYTLKGQETGVYIFVVEGEIRIGGETLNRRDGAGITDVREIELETVINSVCLLIEVPMKDF